ncbi:hypothetical protein J3Q64DRAFT_1768256 [Phycomyces blakesleeanus]|uniref:Uncharacterized protein n=1 Tax=Phycomyces blakesleeanus TaxID=4837 RepID=A0ABR3AMS0_PHYBL
MVDLFILFYFSCVEDFTLPKRIKIIFVYILIGYFKTEINKITFLYFLERNKCVAYTLADFLSSCFFSFLFLFLVER